MINIRRRPDAATGDLWADLDDLQFANIRATMDNVCHFGISETIIAVAIAAGVDATVAAVAVPALIGAGLGAAGSAIMGGNPLTGALLGGISGGFGAIGGLAGDALGIGTTAGGAFGGAAGGALSAGLTGGDPLTGALMGGVQGAASNLFGSSSPDSSSPSLTPSGENVGQGPTVAASSAAASGTVDPNSLGALSAASSASNPLDTSALSSPLGSSLQTPDVSSAAGGNSSLTSLNLPSSGGVGPTTASSSGASSPSIGSQISDYLFGSSTPTTTPSMSLQQAMAQQQATGQAQTFTLNGQTGYISANGTPTMLGAGSTLSKGSTGIMGSGTDSGGGKGIIGGLANNLLSNPLQTALLGTQLYGMASAPSLPTLQQQQASAAGPGFNTNLPRYNATQTRNPIADYYTYGYSPQPTQISTTLTPTTGQGTGNAPITLAAGGMPTIRSPRVSAPRRNSGSGLATLGALSHMRRGSAGTGASASPSGALSAASVTSLPGMARGGIFARQGQVNHGTGTKGQADKVPAMLSEDEYVMPADVTSALGDGSSNAGGSVLDKFVANVRKHKAVRGQPPLAKAPEQYLPARA